MDIKFRVYYPLPGGGQKLMNFAMSGENQTPEALKARIRQVHPIFQNMSEADFAKVEVESSAPMGPKDFAVVSKIMSGPVRVTESNK